VSWQSSIQVLDLAADDRLEMTCRKCGHFRYLVGATLQARKDAERLYLDEVERRARCSQRGCGGQMRMAMAPKGDASGFVGGLA
jgi:hypothetical protein